MAADNPKVALAIRRLLRRARSGTLATALATEGGAPYASLATVAWDGDLSPIFLFSRLSDHTRNLDQDGRASLLIEEASRRANPQTGPRVTLVGRVRPSAPGDEESRHRRRFLARHPRASLYAGFADFGFFRMEIARAHYVGGFARAVWVDGDRFALDAAAVASIAAAEEGVLAHMNADHADAIDLYANRLLKRRGRGWTLVGLDPDGVDLSRNASHARLDFPETVSSAGQVRDVLVGLARAARGGASAAEK